MLEENNVFNLAIDISRFYCKRFKSWEQFDDATQEASLWLLKNRHKWSLTEKELISRGFLALVRWYQNANGLRRKYKLAKVTFDNFTNILDETDIESNLEYNDLIETAIIGAGLEEYRSFLLAFTHGMRKTKAMKIYGPKNFEKADSIITQFKEEFKRRIANDGDRHGDLHEES